MISDAGFAVMIPTAVLINVGRGPVIAEAALLRALMARRIKGAGLDMFEHEPLPTGHPLHKPEKCFAVAGLRGPHSRLARSGNPFLDQYGRFEKSEPLKNIVNKRLGY